jgi:sensor c-di-GMP phosphodiesterase-like protein
MAIKIPKMLIVYCIGFFAIALPITMSVSLAGREGRISQTNRASLMATDVLQRAHKMSQQLHIAIVALEAAHSADPCSGKNIELMRKLKLRLALLADVGYIRDNKLVCSAFGGKNIAVGAPNYISSMGYEIRLDALFVPHARLLISTDPKTGYSGILHEDTLIETFSDHANIDIGLVELNSKTVLIHHGRFNPDWLKKIDSAQDSIISNGETVVAWARSDQFDYAAYAAISSSDVEEARRRAALVMIPLGVVAGLMLLFVMVYLFRRQMTLQSMFKCAVRRNELFLMYQPIVELATGRWVGAEALIRWRRPDGEWISPEIFVPVVEKFHMTKLLAEKVFELIERDASHFLQKHPEFFITINLSAEDLMDEDTVVALKSLVLRMGIMPSNIHVEATERVFMNAESVHRNINALREFGIQVAMDDFGTGYSSLSYLASLELDTLKIDKAFVETIGTETVTSHVISHIIALAKSLNLHMIAEGVETEKQANILRHSGVRHGQGWLYSKAILINQLDAQMDLHEA